MLPTPPSIQELCAAASHAYKHKHYSKAAALYEQLIALEPDTHSHYWHLGLMQLLDGQEAEAQLVWAMAMVEAEPEQAEQWILGLLTVLQAQAEQQEAVGEDQIAWMIRQHIHEVAPTDTDNYLQGLHLALKLEQLQESDIRAFKDALQANPSPALDSDRLWQVLQQFLTQVPEYPAVVELVEACLPWSNNVPAWIAALMSAADKLSIEPKTTTLNRRYVELCLQLDPEHIGALLRLSGYYQDDCNYVEGIETARRCWGICRTLVDKVMGNAILLRGLMGTGACWQEAIATLQQQTELMHAFLAEFESAPHERLNSRIICAPLFFYPYLNDNPRETRFLQNRMAQAYQSSLHRFVENHLEDYRPYPAAPVVRTENRKTIRVGYVSKFLWMHSVGWLSRWVFRHFDRDRFEVYAYFNQQSQVSQFSKEWFASQATRACCFTGDIFGIAQAIREDEIDILVDLDSLTCSQTCGVMALKPAPVQVTWLGLDASGIPAVDYFMADPYVLPEGAEAYYAETIWRLPQTYIAVDGFEVGVPTLRREHLGIPRDAVIYFSSQFAYKRHPDTVRLQMQILKTVPNSYFLVKGDGDQAGIRAFFEQIAEEEGVAGDRLRFLPRDPNEFVHRANLAIADVVLDTYPYNGATTTLETLWMGIPIVTRVGQQFASRNSYTMLMNAGITEGIAYTSEQYVEWGVRLGQDMTLRQQVKWKLWQSRQTSPLWNARQFTRELEKAYEQMWRRHLEN
jgi:predicted O-linked N-acetylglucosamine transferase (SPINDLY family)